MRLRCQVSVVVATWIVSLVTGCFWISSPPSLKTDPVVEIAVLWDRQVSTNLIETAAWTTTNTSSIAAIVESIDLRSWRSSTLLLTAHPTRVILVTQHGQKWELHYLEGDPRRISMFDLGDVGRSGSLLGGAGFMERLTTTMTRELGYAVDLRLNLRGAVGPEGKLPRRVSSATQMQLDRFRPAQKR